MRTSVVIASFVALAAGAPVELPTLPVLGEGAPSVPELDVPSIPEVGLPSLPVALPKLPVKRDDLDLDLGLDLPQEVKDLIDDVEVPTLSVKREDLDLDLGLEIPQEVKDLIDGVETPEIEVKRDDIELEAGLTLPQEVKDLVDTIEVPELSVKRAIVTDPNVEATIDEVVEMLTGLVGGLPVDTDGLPIALPSVPGVALPEVDALGLDGTLDLVINLLVDLVA